MVKLADTVVLKAPTTPLFLRALAGEQVSRLPVWIMRQAGRYLPEYRELRAAHPFLEVCRTPALACEVTLQPLRRFALDASIVFSDIMMPLEAMGVELDFAPGPVIANPVRTAANVAALRVPPTEAIAPYVGETIGLLRQSLKVPLIGFAGAPLTLAAYLVEGKAGKDFAQLRRFLWAEPLAAQLLMEKLAELTVRYLRMQVAAGAQAVQLFDSWAGLLDEASYRRFALPAVQHVLRGLGGLGVPRIYFVHQAAALLGAVRDADAEAIGVDWRVPLDRVRAAVGDRFVLQGNLDPTRLLADPAAARQGAREVMATLRGRRHVFNLGHGILPATPIENVTALIDEVHNFACG